jgi:hypothetical protein
MRPLSTLRCALRWTLAAFPILAIFVLCAAQPIQAGRGLAGPQARTKGKPATVRLRVEVTAGPENMPVPQASVYVKFSSNPKSDKAKLVELNLKTNGMGVTLSPPVPQGKILIQIIAPGWKTFGEWFDINEAEKTVPIHLDKPPAWY